MNPRSETVYLLDDEPKMVQALTRLLTIEGFTVRGFTSVAKFLAAYSADEIGCLVLDVSMPELTGLELQQHLTQNGISLPIVFLTGRGDIPMSVQAIKAGAVDFLTKPVKANDLLLAIRAALRRAASQQDSLARLAVLRQRIASLTPREGEVMQQVVAGRLNKQIAADLGTSEQNIKIHRSRVMEKMDVESVAELVRAVGQLGAANNFNYSSGSPEPSGRAAVD
jgi:FixJ family two-component response regulator